MNTWDQEAIRKSFGIAAANAEQYFKELRERIRRDPQRDSPFVRETHDEHLAKWFVYDSLAFSNALRSREALVAEARRRLETGGGHYASGCFNKEDFEKHWTRHMEALIADYDKV
jgi:ADP-ribose pyrophosphatase YjhB (NUDIX family)